MAKEETSRAGEMDINEPGLDMSNYSRLQRRRERFTQRQVYLFLAGSVVLLILMLLFGVPFVFSLTSRIIGFKKTPETQLNQVDQLAPNAPRLIEEYQATSSAQVKINGLADDKITVELFQNGRSLGTALAKDGKFSYDVELEKGDNEFLAVAIDSSGKRSDQPEAYHIRFSTEPPTLEIENPKDGDSFSENPVLVKGKTEVGGVVTVNDHRVIVGSDGAFEYSLNLANGDNPIKVVATDQAGNRTEKSFTLKFSP